MPDETVDSDLQKRYRFRYLFASSIGHKWRTVMKETDNKDKIWFWATIATTLLVMLIFALPTIIIDPYFHYHEPLKEYGYTFWKQRYSNDGIVRNFDYDAYIVGSSMTENFKASEASELFGYHFIKVPYSGGYYKELDHLIQRSYTSDNDIHMIIRCLDYSKLAQDKDAEHEEKDPLHPQCKVPDYMVNTNPFDDVKYVLNKNILLNETFSTYMNIRSEEPTTDFDSYSNWCSEYKFGKEAVLEGYSHSDEVQPEKEFTDDDYEMIKGNIDQNVISTINRHPETAFYLFFPPYSICYWDSCHSNGTIKWNVEAERTAIELLLKCPNVKLFSFTNDFELTCNLDNYKDQAHYGEWVNSYILVRMHEGENLLTKDNYEKYLDEICDFYSNYDYSIYAVNGEEY